MTTELSKNNFSDVTANRAHTSDLAASSQETNSSKKEDLNQTTRNFLHTSKTSDKSTTNAMLIGNSSGPVSLSSDNSVQEAVFSKYQTNLGTLKNIRQTNTKPFFQVVTATYEDDVVEPVHRNFTGQHSITGSWHGRLSTIGIITSISASTATNKISETSSNTRNFGATGFSDVSHLRSNSPKDITEVRITESYSKNDLEISSSAKIEIFGEGVSRQLEVSGGIGNTTVASRENTGCSSDCAVNHTVSHSKESVKTTAALQYTSLEYEKTSMKGNVEDDTTIATPTTEIGMKVRRSCRKVRNVPSFLANTRIVNACFR